MYKGGGGGGAIFNVVFKMVILVNIVLSFVPSYGDGVKVPSVGESFVFVWETRGAPLEDWLLVMGGATHCNTLQLAEQL